MTDPIKAGVWGRQPPTNNNKQLTTIVFSVVLVQMESSPLIPLTLYPRMVQCLSLDSLYCSASIDPSLAVCRSDWSQEVNRFQLLAVDVILFLPSRCCAPCHDRISIDSNFLPVAVHYCYLAVCTIMIVCGSTDPSLLNGTDITWPDVASCCFLA
jgi:hypothetical protein